MTVLEYQWPFLESFLAPSDVIEQSAKEYGAMRRKRRVDSASTLLRLALAYGFCGMSLRQTTAWAEAAGVASLSDVALLNRLRSSCDWLGYLLALKLADRAQPPTGCVQRLRLVDATTISQPGSTGTDWRVHLGLDLGTSRIDQVEVTGVGGGETLKRFSFRKGDVVIGDRGYARRAGLSSVVRNGADFIVRMPWSTLPLQNRDGNPFDLFAFLRGLPEGESGQVSVELQPDSKNGLPAIPVRLVAVRKTEAAAEEARKNILRMASKKQHVPDPRSFEAAAYVVLVTSLESDSLSASQTLDLYRFRWQIEVAFRRMKGLLELDELPAKDPSLARTFIYAKLLAALLLDDFTHAFVSFSPWGFNLREETSFPLADSTGPS